MDSPVPSPWSSSERLNEFTSLDELALVNSSSFALRRRLPLRTASSPDGVDVGVVQQSRLGLLRVPRLRLLRRLAKRLRLACASLLHRPTSPAEPVAPSSLDSATDAGQDLGSYDPGFMLALDAQEQLGDLPDDLKYDPVRHANADVRAHLYITDEVWRCIGEQAAGYFVPQGCGFDEVQIFYMSVLFVTDEVNCVLPPSLERDHSINTMRKLARDMMNDPGLRREGFWP